MIFLVQEDGDTEQDREARALLNKFIGANILMSSIETTTGSVPGGPNKGNKNQVSGFSVFCSLLCLL